LKPKYSWANSIARPFLAIRNAHIRHAVILILSAPRACPSIWYVIRHINKDMPAKVVTAVLYIALID